MESKLAVVVRESGLEQTKAQVLLDNFTGYFDIAREWEEKAMDIVVVSANQKVEMKIARAGRLFLREKRIQIEKTRKELKEQSLREGKAIDGIANVLKALIVPIEEYLGKQEKFVEIKATEVAELARIEIEEKVERARLIKEEADRKEQERIRVENERLKKEAIAKEKKLQAEREKVESERIAQETRVRVEKAQTEYKARVEKEKQEKILAEQKANRKKEREESQAKLKAFAQKLAETEEKVLEDKIRKEREKTQARLDERIECPFCHKEFVIGAKVCGICHGEGSTTDHHDPCSNCGGKGYIG